MLYAVQSANVIVPVDHDTTAELLEENTRFVPRHAMSGHHPDHEGIVRSATDAVPVEIRFFPDTVFIRVRHNEEGTESGSFGFFITAETLSICVVASSGLALYHGATDARSSFILTSSVDCTVSIDNVSTK